MSFTALLLCGNIPLLSFFHAFFKKQGCDDACNTSHTFLFHKPVAHKAPKVIH